MTIGGLLGRFFLFYAVLIIAIGAALTYFGVNGGGSVNLGILVFLVFWLCEKYGKANSRYFTGKEKAAVVAGMIIIDFILQFIFASLAMVSGEIDIDAETLVILTLITAILHSLTIYLFVSLVKKRLITQGIIRGDTAGAIPFP